VVRLKRYDGVRRDVALGARQSVPTGNLRDGLFRAVPGREGPPSLRQTDEYATRAVGMAPVFSDCQSGHQPEWKGSYQRGARRRRRAQSAESVDPSRKGLQSRLLVSRELVERIASRRCRPPGSWTFSWVHGTRTVTC